MSDRYEIMNNNIDIKQLKGIGDKTADMLNRLSVYTVNDLVGLYPRDYDVYEEPVFVSSLSGDLIDSIVSIETVIAKRVEVYRNGKLTIISTFAKDVNGDAIKCIWYNMPYLASTLKVGMRYVLRGYLRKKNGSLVIEHPDMYTVTQYNELKGSMQPIYPLTKGLSNKTVVKAVKQALELCGKTLSKEFIPDDIRRKYELSEHNYAVNTIHFPVSMKEYTLARKRLAFEEFFLFVLAVRSLKNCNERLPNGYVINNSEITDKFIAGLPFKLTGAQLKTWEEIKDNMSGDRLMSRLVQGDVGSGKTIVAVISMLNTALAGYQAAMMVPTEVLARQQYEAVVNMFEAAGLDIRVELLTGSTSAANKRDIYKRLSEGDIDIIIGTHALIQDNVIYKRLALVITDEQHRFGVNQRKAFSEKGMSDKGTPPHVLVMSATPIPRTLAIIVYGDLDISVIDELPAERLPIKNCVVDESYRNTAYTFIQGQIKEGRQIYIICPMVEDSEHIDAENVVEYSKRLKSVMPQSVRIAYLHGKMKPGEKNEIMTAFAAGDIDILVSTTVIEVGVNVTNATVMMVENSERFGLAQLHQLRGRVGRGKYQSYCIFMSGNQSKKTKERLQILNQTNDGFKIAEEDLRLRGPGDFFGVRQSGDLDFGIGDIYTDSKVLKIAADSAGEVLLEDPYLELEKNHYLAEKVHIYTLKCLEKINL